MREICILLQVVVAIMNLAGVMLGFPASPEKMNFIFGLNAGVALITIITLVFEKRK